MKKLFFFVFLVSVFVIGCTNSPKFTDISKYHLEPDALSDGEQVKIIAGVIGEQIGTDAVYYNILVAVSQQTGDTVNILIDVDPAVRESDMGKVYNYIAPTNELYIMMKNTMKEGEAQGASEIQRVVYTKGLDKIIEIGNPTVFGMVGTMGSMSK